MTHSIQDRSARSDSTAWTVQKARQLYSLPLPELLFQAQALHREHHANDQIQLCSLLSVKTGACPEDCAYCSQSSRYKTEVNAEKMISVEEVLAKAKVAKEQGATRFCMGAAWRQPKEGRQWQNILAMVRGVRDLDMEACVTLGMLNAKQVQELKEAGLSAYNHNLDTSRTFYGQVISSRTFDDRLKTLAEVAKAGVSICSGGIIGMGESRDDRLAMLVTLANLNPQPESIPINALVPMPGTPLADADPVDSIEFVRLCAVARLMNPRARVRLSAGRKEMNRETQLLCFMAGANSIFYGDTLLTTDNPEVQNDQQLLRDAGMKPKPFATSPQAG